MASRCFVSKDNVPFKMGYNLDLESPKTFNEKLQWLKLYNRKPEYTQMVDKYEVKKLVEKYSEKNTSFQRWEFGTVLKILILVHFQTASF